MSDINQPVVDLIAGTAAPKSQTIGQRIERRLEILRHWLRDGIPVGKAIPRSLNAARLWEDVGLNIQPIKSPNEFTTTHHEHGQSVRDIAGLLTALRNRYGRPAKSSVAARPASAAQFDRRAFDRTLEAAVSQWHTERDQRLEERKRADSAESRSAMLLDENAHKDQLIADLRRQLAAQKSLRVVE